MTILNAGQRLCFRVSVSGRYESAALDFGGIRGTKKRECIAAVHAGLSRDYDPMTKIFREVIARTLRSAAKASSV
jgi:hypothetical protein